MQSLLYSTSLCPIFNIWHLIMRVYGFIFERDQFSATVWFKIKTEIAVKESCCSTLFRIHQLYKKVAIFCWLTP